MWRYRNQCVYTIQYFESHTSVRFEIAMDETCTMYMNTHEPKKSAPKKKKQEIHRPTTKSVRFKNSNFVCSCTHLNVWAYSMHVRNLIFWHLNISECASKRNTRNNEKRSRCQIRVFFSFHFFFIFWCIFFVPFLLLIRKNQKNTVSFSGHSRSLCHIQFQSGLLFVCGCNAIQLNRFHCI